MARQYRLSIIIPCYNESSILLQSYNEIIKILEVQFKNDNIQIIFVNDGSTDDTNNILDMIQNNHNICNISLLCIHNKSNRGKGYSVKKGIEVASGGTIIYCDADLSTDLKDLQTAVNYIENGYSIAMGSRCIPNSIMSNRSLSRSVISRLCNWLIRLLFGWDVYDTQCGFKAMNKSFAKSVIKVQVIERFAFDIEYIDYAFKNNLKIVSFPVVWKDRKNSKVSIIKDTIVFVRDIVKIKWKRY